MSNGKAPEHPADYDRRALGSGVSESERERRLRTPQAQRLLAAARRLVAQKGVQGSRVEEIAAAAGMSQGLLTYYFGPKDRLMTEVMRADARERVERLAELHDVATVDELLETLPEVMFASMSEGAQLALQELGHRAVRDATFGAAYRAMERGYQDALASILADLEQRDVVTLGGDACRISGVLIALGRGIAARSLVDPDWDALDAWRCASVMARALLSPTS